MEKRSNFVIVGKIASAKGLKGELFVYLYAREAAWKDQWKMLYLTKDEKGRTPEERIPILSIQDYQRQKQKGFLIKIAGVSDRSQAEELVGQRVLIPTSFLVSKKGETIYLGEILGFEVRDKTRGPIGKIVDFSDNGAQDLIEIKSPEGDLFEVPLVEPILENIDFDQKIISMNIPYGLVYGEDL